MFLLNRPHTSVIEEFVNTNSSAPFSYQGVGKTGDRGAPKGYIVDHNREVLGNGRDVFERAKIALRAWKMFEMDWIELCWPTTPIAVGQTVAILISHYGFYSLNAARIVYTIDEERRFGFAYGTLDQHGESGEERFLVEIDNESDDVRYDLFAFSRPNHVLARLGYSLARGLQKRFAIESMASMKRSAQI